MSNTILVPGCQRVVQHINVLTDPSRSLTFKQTDRRSSSNSALAPLFRPLAPLADLASLAPPLAPLAELARACGRWFASKSFLHLLASSLAGRVGLPDAFRRSECLLALAPALRPLSDPLLTSLSVTDGTLIDQGSKNSRGLEQTTLLTFQGD